MLSARDRKIWFKTLNQICRIANTPNTNDSRYLIGSRKFSIRHNRLNNLLRNVELQTLPSEQAESLTEHTNYHHLRANITNYYFTSISCKYGLQTTSRWISKTTNYWLAKQVQTTIHLKLLSTMK